MTRFDPSFHFTAMPLCTPAVESILIADNDDLVFTDPAGTDGAPSILKSSILLGTSWVFE